MSTIPKVPGSLNTQATSIPKINGTDVPSEPSTNTVLVATDSDSAVWAKIIDGYVSASAAIAGTKISPNFGSQNIVTTGTAQAASVVLGSSGPTITTGSGVPATTPVEGSVFLRQDGTSSTGVYTYQDGAWAVIAGGGGAVSLTGDVSGTTSASVVEKINGATAPAAGALTTGNVLKVTGTSALSYGAVNLAGGSNHVTGTLPIGNQAARPTWHRRERYRLFSQAIP